MCGIAGFAGDGDLEVLGRMCARLTHRGPDDQAGWRNKAAGVPVCLGFRRLVVLDPDGGKQPMLAGDGETALVFNGEIYNFLELRAELEQLGHLFLTRRSDTEVLLHAYLQWGEDMVERLSGMFAFVIYDERRSVLFCARDRFGKKPLFYSMGSQQFVFASEATALFEHPAVSMRVSERGLRRYFSLGCIPAPDSLYEGVSKLPPGHVLSLSLQTMRADIRPYWTFRIRADTAPAGTPRDWADQTRHLLDRAVARRLHADVPLGFFLSGGIDSTSIVALASGHSADVRTFSIGFRDPSYDESQYAAQAARDYGASHEARMLDYEMAEETAGSVLGAMDEPISDPSLLPTAMLSAFAREQVTVALAGDGGDELFAGYDTFSVLRWAPAIRHFPNSAWRAASRIARLLPVGQSNMSLDFRVRRALRGFTHGVPLWHPLWLAPVAPSELGRLLGRSVGAEELYADAAERWDRCESPHLVDRGTEYYVNYYLSANLLTKVDRASMHHSLEVRTPFLDNDLVDFAATLPHWARMRGRTRKWILRSAMRPLVRREILNRRKKGFGIPVVSWLRRMECPDHVRAESLGLDGRWLQQCWHEHRARRADHRGLLWAWYALDACVAAKLGGEALPLGVNRRLAPSSE